MFTLQENERATQVGPGTPGGDLLRRYWFPVAALHELTEENPTRFVRLLGEDLVLFRDQDGRVGLLADRCSHRGASLLYGRVEARGLACAYHGWLYDTAGNVLECPAEPQDSLFHLTVKHRAYPVEALFGLYWAYLGPAPAPPLRKLDIMQYPIELVRVELEYQANWVQVMENNLDGSHILILHQDTMGARDPTGQRIAVTSTTRGLIDELVDLEYRELSAGIMRTLITSDGYVEEDMLIFPNMLRRMNTVSMKVPVDDFHTKKFAVSVRMSPESHNDSGEEETGYRTKSPDLDAKTPPYAPYPQAHFRMDKLFYQDTMVIETQGRTSAREAWHLATRDAGVAMFDRMILREIDRVERGLEPMGAGAAFVDTNLESVHVVGLR
jgi:5,5'-dehydrodivanillate O-demethylase